MAEAIRIRAKFVDGVTDVHILMPHPMETGLRKDDSGNFIPAHYINDIKVSSGGRIILHGKMSLAVSRDPLIHFRFKGAAPGERITVEWTDNHFDRREGEAQII